MLSKADTHVHTYYSGVSNYKALRFPESVTTPESQVDAARANGMGVVCITDHDAIEGAFRAQEHGRRLGDIDVVAGEEVMTDAGEIVGIWLNEWIPPRLSPEETVDIIHGQGGLAIAPHPFSFYVDGLKDRVKDLKLDGIEVINGGHVDRFTNTMAQRCFFENPGRWAAIGASDGHSNYTVGYTWTEFEGRGEADLRKAILAKSTIPCGRPAPVFAQVQWSIEVVTGAQRMLAKSLLHKLEDVPGNPLIAKMNSLNEAKKIGGIVGGLMYVMPPMPFIGAWLATTWLKTKAYAVMDELMIKMESRG